MSNIKYSPYPCQNLSVELGINRLLKSRFTFGRVPAYLGAEY